MATLRVYVTPMLIPPGEVERIIDDTLRNAPCGGWPDAEVEGSGPVLTAIATAILTAATSAHEKAMRELVYARSQVIASVCTAMDVAIALHNDPKSKPWSREHLCDFLETLRHDLSKLAALSSVTFGGGK